MMDTAFPHDLVGKDLLRSPNDVASSVSDRDLQRATGRCRIVLGGSEKGTYVVDVLQESPIRVMFPRACGDAPEEAVLINTAGGVAGGDRLEFAVTTLAHASAAVTSQAAEKVYRALDEPARITTKLKACDDSRLAWLPQGTIVFNGARLHRHTEIDLCSGVEFLALEWLALGRAARGEEMTAGSISERWSVRRDGRLIWADCFRVDDETFPHLRRNALLAKSRAIATLVYFGPDLDQRLQSLRDIAACSRCCCAATLVGGLIVVRLAANLFADLRFAMRSLLRHLERELAPGPFRIPKMWSC